MRVSRPVKRLLASVLVVSLAAACSSSQGGSDESQTQASRGPTPSPRPVVLTNYPSGFPTVYTHDVDTGPTLLQPVPGGLRHDSSGTLRADDGTTGTYAASWVENRIPAGSTECDGLTYPALYTTELPAITMEVNFPEWGHAFLLASDRTVIFQSSRNGSSPAVCDQINGGTYEFEFTSGPVKGLQSGTWHWEADGRLVFDPPPGASPSASPSESPS